jgi:dienelactone hydrolase
MSSYQDSAEHQDFDENISHQLKEFLIDKSELVLTFHHPSPEKKLAYHHYQGDFRNWKESAKQKFTELINYNPPEDRIVNLIREKDIGTIRFRALIMEVSSNLSIPAYLLIPTDTIKGFVMAIHGHGSVEPIIGLRDGPYHKFAYELAKSGYMVLAPELRGFSTLNDLAQQIPIDRLDYWQSHMNFTLITDGFLHGETLIGQTIEDLIAWENWFYDQYGFEKISVAGISYGGDLALYYPVFSTRVDKIFASGSLGSFNLIFSRCYNAPAHCIPGILKWLDRSDIAGLNVPTPIMLHYGELDVPSIMNHSAAYNESVDASLNELRNIYAQEGADDNVQIYVTPKKFHEMDNELLKTFLNDSIK